MSEKKKLVLPEWAQILREISDDDPEGYSIEAVKSNLNLEFLRGMAWMYDYTVHTVPANLDPNFDYPIIRKLEEEIQEKIFDDISMYLMSEIREVMVSMLDDESFRDLTLEEIGEQVGSEKADPEKADPEKAEPVKEKPVHPAKAPAKRMPGKKRRRRSGGSADGAH